LVDIPADVGYNIGMDNQFLALILSDKLRELQPDVAYVYILLRSDIHLGHTGISVLHRGFDRQVSGLSVQSIAQNLHSSEESVRRCLEDLCKRRWVKKYDDGYQLGADSKWYVDVPFGEKTRTKEHSAIDLVRKAAREGADHIKEMERRRLAAPVEDAIKREILDGVVNVSSKDRTVVIERFQSLYSAKFGGNPEVRKAKSKRSYNAQVTSYVSRGIVAFGYNVGRLCELIDFMFDNWTDIRSSRITAKVKPDWSLLGSKTFWRKIELVEIHGVEYFSDYGVKSIREYFENRHKEIWGYPPKDLTSSEDPAKKYGVKNKMVAAALRSMEGDGERLMKVIDYTYDNWDSLKIDFGWSVISPGWTLLMSDKFLHSIESRISREFIKDSSYRGARP
jgi:hypothetical protein